ncbi:hypothetical protein LE190_11250 [Massilia oculi]|uniref:MARCKS-like protein n=1 Tax=Massilia hydrophila TaxID=3044279 RepID=A0ABS7YBW5_9BURK|nr:hypothetical protein [Massilia oculi]MCA1856492.1 hypothetical protein [Massilia oculi]
MNDPTRKPDPAAKGGHVFHEADIGSGEKSPGELETEEMIREIPPLPPSGGQPKQPKGEQAGARDASHA